MSLRHIAFCLVALVGVAACAPQPVTIYKPAPQPVATPVAPKPAAPKAPKANTTGTAAHFRNVVGSTIFFEVDQSSLTGAARSRLNAQAAWLQRNVGFALVIQGHADEQGTREYNFALSARRASAAQEYLVSRGVRASRIRIVPYGKERPAAVCSEESCYARNRRAVSVVRNVVGG
ncbi:MAG: OmpA family protein [Primorskyibacter sp.]